MAALRTALPRLPARPPWPVALAGAACAVWTVLVLSAAADDASNWPVLTAGPPGAAVVLALGLRGGVPQWLRVTLIWTSLVAGGILAAAICASQPYLGAAPIIIAAAAAVAARWPVLCYAAAFGLAGAWSSLELYTGLPISYMVDFFLVGLWTTLVWGWITGTRHPRLVAMAGLAAVGAYIAYVLVGVLAAEPMIRGVFGFRVLMWYFAAIVLVPLVLQGKDRRERALQAVLIVGSLIAAYTMLRWAIGPGAKEAENATRIGRGFSESLEGELRLFGALQRPQVLGAWCAAIAPFGLVALLSPMALWWRALGGALTGMVVLAVVASDARAAMAGVAIGLVAVLLFFGLGRGFAGRRGPALIIGLVLVVVAGGGVAVSRLNATDSTKSRFEGLLNPFEDLSFQERQVKWKTILAEVDGRPFGFGVGASGEAQQRYGRYLSSVSVSPDSTYVKMMYDLGAVGLGLFVIALLAVLASLVSRVLRSPDPLTATLATASAATLVAFSVVIGTGEYAEGLQGLVPWLLVGLGLAPGDGD